MSMSTRLFGPRFDPAPGESQWVTVLAQDPDATTATTTWPSNVRRGVTQQAGLSSQVARSIRSTLAIASVTALIYPAAAALVYDPALPWGIAICVGNLLAAAAAWQTRLRFVWPWPRLQVAPEDTGSAWGPVLASNDRRVRAQLAMYATIVRLLTLSAAWMGVVTLVAAIMIVRA